MVVQVVLEILMNIFCIKKSMPGIIFFWRIHTSIRKLRDAMTALGPEATIVPLLPPYSANTVPGLETDDFGVRMNLKICAYSLQAVYAYSTINI